MVLSIIHTAAFILFSLLVNSLLNKDCRFLRYPISIFVSFCYLSLIFGLFGMAGIGFSIQLSLVVLVISSIPLLIHYSKDKSKKSMSIIADWKAIVKPMDVLAFLVIVLICAYCGFQLFGSPLSLNYETSDPANHYAAAVRVINGEPCSSQFFCRLVSAYIMVGLQPFVSADLLPFIFVIADILLFILSGLVFFGVARYLAKNTAPFAVLCLAIFYILGYPLNNLVFGFGYLGTGVSLIACILFFTARVAGVIDCNVDEIGFSSLVASGRSEIAALALSLFGLICSYSLFVPPVYLAVFLYIAVILIKRRVALHEVALIEFAIFAVPVFIGYLIVYVSMFGGPKVGSSASVGSSIATEGYIYRDLFSSFVLIAPFAFAGLYFSVKAEDHSDKALPVMTVIFVAYMITLFCLGLLGRVSSYYFFKCHFVLWLLFFLAAASLLGATGRAGSVIFSSFFAVVFGLMFVVFTGSDGYLSAKRQLFNPAPSGYSFFQVVNFNHSRFNLGRMPLDQVFEYERVGDFCSDSEGDAVAYFLGGDKDAYWFRALNGYDYGKFYWHLTRDKLVQSLSSYSYVYVSSANSSLMTSDGVAFKELAEYVYSNYELVYSGEYGALYKIG